MKFGHNPQPLLYAAKQLRKLAATINAELADIDRWEPEAPRLEHAILMRQFDVRPDDAAGIAQLSADRAKMVHIGIWVNGARRRLTANREAVIYTCKGLYEQVWDAVDFTRREIDIIVFELNESAQHANFLIPTGYDREISTGAVKTAEWIERFVADVQPELAPVPAGYHRKSNELLLRERRDQLTRK